MLQTHHKKSLLGDMLRLRLLSERIETEYLKDEMHTPVHLYTGQEAIAVGACAALRRDDYISSNHRSHGHYLAKGGLMRPLVAEFYGRLTGCSRGFGGSMHVIAPEVGHLGSSAIVGGGIPIGTGHALAFKMRGEDRVSLIFFGDGASEEGVLYESVNFAVLKRLPAVYLLENNAWAVCSPRATRQAENSIFHRAYSDDLLPAARVDGNDVEAVYDAVNQAVERARRGGGPSFIEAVTYRIAGHAGCRAQDPPAYRDSDEVERWRARCPIKSYGRLLLDEGAISEAEIASLKERAENEVNDAFVFALHSPPATAANSTAVVFCE